MHQWEEEDDHQLLHQYLIFKVFLYPTNANSAIRSSSGRMLKTRRLKTTNFVFNSLHTQQVSPCSVLLLLPLHHSRVAQGVFGCCCCCDRCLCGYRCGFRSDGGMHVGHCTPLDTPPLLTSRNLVSHLRRSLRTCRILVHPMSRCDSRNFSSFLNRSCHRGEVLRSSLRRCSRGSVARLLFKRLTITPLVQVLWSLLEIVEGKFRICTGYALGLNIARNARI